MKQFYWAAHNFTHRIFAWLNLARQHIATGRINQICPINNKSWNKKTNIFINTHHLSIYYHSIYMTSQFTYMIVHSFEILQVMQTWLNIYISKCTYRITKHVYVWIRKWRHSRYQQVHNVNTFVPFPVCISDVVYIKQWFNAL